MPGQVLTSSSPAGWSPKQWPLPDPSRTTPPGARVEIFARSRAPAVAERGKRGLYTIAQQHPSGARRCCSRMLGMAGTNPSDILLELKSISESSTARKPNSQLGRASNCHVRPRTHLKVVRSKHHHDIHAAKSNLRPEQINQCMLLLLVICIMLAGSIVGVVAYFASQWR
jgi:hypothetical protein